MFTDITLEPIIAGFITLFPLLVLFLQTTSTMLGVMFIYSGLKAVIAENPNATVDTKKREMWMKCIAGSLLITIAFQFQAFSYTFFPTATDASLNTALDTAMYNKIRGIQDGSTYFYSSMASAGFAAVCFLIGFYGFIKSIFLIGKKGENGSMHQAEVSGSKILSYMVGGFVLTQMWRVV